MGMSLKTPASPKRSAAPTVIPPVPPEALEASHFAVHFESVLEAAKALKAYSQRQPVKGLCLKTQRAYEPGRRVSLLLEVAGERLELQGVIAWVHRAAEAIGVRFEGLSPLEQTRLERLMAHASR